MKRNCFLLLLWLLAVPAYAQDTAVPQSQAQINLSFAPVVKKVSPAVVNIYTKTRVQVRELSPFMDDPFFNQFFGGKGMVFGDRTREKVVSSLGSGVLVKPGGMIVTSLHVIKDADQITVALSDKREFEAKVTMRDPQSDLAFLSITAPGPLPYLDMRDSDTLEVGDLVLAIGNPFGVGQTVTQGIISALARKAAGVSDYQFFIQTDAAINPGNSGGALVDMQGKLIGINTAIYSKSGGNMGIGFAIPANTLRALMGNEVQEGRVVKPWLGAAAQTLNPEMAQSLGLPPSQGGAIINKIFQGSPAEHAGLQVGDVVTAVNGNAVASEPELRYRMSLGRVGDQAGLQIIRGGKTLMATVQMQPPAETVARDIRKLVGRHPLSGLSVANLSPALAVEMGVDDMEASGVIVVAVAEGLGQSLGIAPGDIIVEINGAAMHNTLEVERMMKKNADGWKVTYKHGDKLLTLTVRI